MGEKVKWREAKALRDHLAAAKKTLREIAQQMTSTERAEIEEIDVDYEPAHDMFIHLCRATLEELEGQDDDRTE